jgi:outer membrane protein
MEGLRVLTGTGDDQPLVLAPVHVTVRLAEGDPHQLAKQAVEGNPGVSALGEKVQAAQAGVTQARAAYRPHVNLLLSQAWNDQQVDLANSSGTAALVLRWNVLDFGSRGGAVDQANAKVIESQGSLRKAQDDLQVKVRTAWEDVQLATTRISVKQTALSDAAESARLAQLRYENGVITFTQLLDAQAVLNKARADLVSARYQKVMAGAGLLLALGRLEP